MELELEFELKCSVPGCLSHEPEPEMDHLVTHVAVWSALPTTVTLQTYLDYSTHL